MSNWIRVCAAGEIDEEDLIRFDHDGQSFCVYNTEKGWGGGSPAPLTPPDRPG